MKKIISALLLIMSCVAHADLLEDHARYISELQTKLAKLQSKTDNLQGKTDNLQNQINNMIRSARPLHKIGEEYHGGLIFYVDETGQHGLIASKIDVNGEGVQWRNGSSGNKITNARGDGIGAGETNTRLIIAQQTIDNQNGVFAASEAAQFQVMADGVTPCKTPIPEGSICYGGWYLPSAHELQLMHANLHQKNLSAFAPEYYWSSTEANVSTAWLQNFSSGEITVSSKSNTLGRVRAITRF
jgi:hypothetical protein